MPGEVFFAPALEVFEEDVAEDACRDALGFQSEQAGGHFFLVLVVGTALADEDLFQMQTDGLGLAIKQLKPHAMHGDALEVLVAGGEQGDDFVALVGLDPI